MKLRSRGLGRRELLMDFREYDIARDGDDVVVSGTIREPVNWDFAIRISGDDIPGMLRVGLHRHTLSLAARWILHIRSRPSAVPTSPVSAPSPIARPARSLRPMPAERELAATGSEGRAATPKPAPIAHIRRPASQPEVRPVDDGRPVSTPSRTPDFGVPRRRGSEGSGR